MSRIGKLTIIIPEGTSVEISGHLVKVTGPKGKLQLRLPDSVILEVTSEQLKVVPKDTSRRAKEQHGLVRTLIANLIEGVNNGFSKQLEIQGVGYRAQLEGRKLMLSLGFSHPIEYELPEDIEVTIQANILTVAGIDKSQVGQVAAEIRSFRKPEPYKGKGIRYVGEAVRRKAGKTAAKVGG